VSFDQATIFAKIIGLRKNHRASQKSSGFAKIIGLRKNFRGIDAAL
jgi:hypothetical protein